MTSDRAKDITDLKEKIRIRRELLVKYINFIEQIVFDRGKVISREEGSSNIHIVRFLKNFGDFSFFVSDGETMMGGNTMKAWYHPGKTFEFEKPPMHAMPRPDMEIHNFGVERDRLANGCTVDTFERSEVWQDALNAIIIRKDEIIEKMDKENAAALEKQHKDHEEERELENLRKEAGKLGIV